MKEKKRKKENQNQNSNDVSQIPFIGTATTFQPAFNKNKFPLTNWGRTQKTFASRRRKFRIYKSSQLLSKNLFIFISKKISEICVCKGIVDTLCPGYDDDIYDLSNE